MKNFSSYKKLDILDGTEILFARNHTVDFPKHTHDTFNIALVINQTFYSRLDSKFLQAPIGTLCITNPDEVHETPCDKNTGNTFITFYIAPDILTRLNRGVSVFFNNKVIYNPILFSSFYSIAQNIENEIYDPETALLHALKQLVANYAVEIDFKNSSLNLFQEFINEESFDKFSLEKTARNFGMDKFKFLRLFKQETGLTPNTFVTLKRIASAKKELLKNENLLDVAVSSGFYDASHLTREFKKYTGVTPGIYREA